LQKQLAEVLKSGGINIDFLLNNSSLQNLTSDFTSKVEVITKKLEHVQEVIESNRKYEIADNEYHLSVGNGFLVNKEWKKAAHHLEIASLSQPEDWNLHLTIGICYANIRGGRLTNIKSIEAYTRAIIHIPVIDKEVKGKTYIYRGAMLKRINKLDEAELDVKFGLSQTKSKRFQSDGLYNLACIYAMRNDREELFQVMNKLKPTNAYMNTIRHHLKDYFKNFENDKEFIDFISVT
jgi:tetratricopeptide (TPR) repeat protein